MSNEINISNHISSTFNEELENIRQSVMMMGGMVEEQLKNSLKSIIDGDVPLAKKVIAKDDDVNNKDLEIEKLCIEIIALRQPAASDLRLVISVLKTITDLERIGDCAVKLARMGKKLTSNGYSMKYYDELEKLGQKAIVMLQSSLDSFARLDVETSLKAMEIEPQINIQSRELARKISKNMVDDPTELKKTLKLLTANSTLERIGDHCENICENVIYLVEGEDIRYLDFDTVKNKITSESLEEGEEGEESED